MVAQSIKDADTFFGIELPAVTEWTFGAEQAAAIHRPVLSVLGAETQPLWVEIAEFLRSSLPYIEDCTIEGAGHLLQIQRPEPVARAMAEFLGAKPHCWRLRARPTLHASRAGENPWAPHGERSKASREICGRRRQVVDKVRFSRSKAR